FGTRVTPQASEIPSLKLHRLFRKNQLVFEHGHSRIALAIEFHHRSCNSIIGQDHSPAPVLTRSTSPPTVPIRAALTPNNRARSTTLTASCRLVEITMRPWVSPKSTASRRPPTAAHDDAESSPVPGGAR